LTEELDQKLKRTWLVWRLALQYGIGVVILIFYVTTSLHFQYTPDDTYIYLQFGRNIARGEGFAFNAGTPTYGVTGPLWAFLIAAGVKLNLDPFIVAKTLDIVFASLSIIAVLAFAFVLIRDRIYALIAAWIFSFDCWFLRWTGTGMETSLGVLLTMMVLWYAYRKEYIASSLVAGLLTLVRPEGGLLFIAVLVDAGLNGRERAATMRAVLGSLLLYGIVVGSWILYSSIQFGTIIPNTLFAKSTSDSSMPELWYDFVSNLKIVGATQIVLVLFLVVGVVVTLRRSGWGVLKEEGFPLLWVLLLPLFYVFMKVQVQSRYLLLILPIIVIYGVWGIKRLELASFLSPRRGLLILLIVAGVSLAQNQYIYRRWVLPHMENFELGVNECLKPIAYWLRSNSPEGSSVLTPDIGVIGYVSEIKVFDTAGLVRREIKLALGRDGYDEYMLGRKYVQILHPDYIIDRSPTPDRLESDTLKPIMTRPFPGLGLSRPELTYYTLYRVVK
jgi:hypothetical protein